MVTLTVTDNNGKTSTATSIVTVEDNVAPVVNTKNITVQLDENGQATIITTDIDNGSNDACGIQSTALDITNFDCTNIGSNTVTLIVIDNNDNSNTGTATITVEDNIKPILPTVDNITWGCEYTVEAPVAQDNCGGEITGQPSRSTTFTETGTITWTFTDNSGNFDTLEQTITINPIVAEIETTDISCFGFDNGSAVVTANGGVGNLIYDWGSLSGTGNSKDNLKPGNYMATVSDQNGCSIELPFIISQPDDLQMTTDPSSTPASCSGGNDGTISAGTVSGGTLDENGNYQYSMDNENWNSTGEFSNMEAGTHTIFVVDANDCALQVTINVEEPDVINATLNKTDVSCFEGSDGSISLNNLSGGRGEVYFRIVGTTEWTESTESIGNLQTGLYQIELQDDNGCIVELTNSIQIQEPDSHISVSLPENIRTQQYGTTTASVIPTVSGGTPNYTYEWRRINEDNSLSEVLQTSQRANSLPAGNYQLVVTDANSCVSEPSEFEVIEEVDAYILESSYCASNNDDIRASEFYIDIESMRGGVGDPQEDFKYRWSFGSGATPNLIIDENDEIPYENDELNYNDKLRVFYNSPGTKTITLWVTDESGVTSEHTFSHYVGECFEPCGNAQDIQFNIENFFFGYDYNGNPNIDRSEIEIDECDDNRDIYLYIDITKISQMHSLTAEIKYTIEKNGETTLYQAIGVYNGDNVKEGLFPIFQVGPDDDQINWECGDELSITFANFSWTKGNGNGGGRGNGKNGPHCLGFNTEISVPTPLTATATPQDALCFNDASGSIIINARGGTRSYEYSKDGGANYQSSNTFLNLSAETYNNLIVRDSDGKTLNIDPLTIGEPNQISIEDVQFEEICFGKTTSAKVLNPSGGTPLLDGNDNQYYEYLWSNGQTGQEVTDLSGGIYTVIIIDANGCQIEETFTIIEPEELISNAGEDQQFNCGFTKALLSANTPEIGIGKWEISEGNGGSFEDDNDPNTTFTGNASTDYILDWIITDDDTCPPEIDSVSISFSEDCSTLDFDGIDDHVFLGDNYGFTSGNFSIEAWIRPKSINNTRTIFSKRNSKDLSKGLDLIINSGAPTFRWGNKSVTTSHKVTANRWHHIAAIYNNGNIRLYVDGIRVGNATSTNPAVVNAPAIIGAMYNADNPDVPVNYFHGWIEEVRLWKIALTEEQLRFMMNQRIEIPEKPEDVIGSDYIKGEVLPIRDKSYLQDEDNFHLDQTNKPWAKILWSELIGYLPLISQEPKTEGYIPFKNEIKPQAGKTPNFGMSGVPGELRNIETNQENTAPLPYESQAAGTWHNRNSWDPNSNKFWTFPNDTGINGTPIDWNIAIQKDNINSNNKVIKLLGLLSGNGTQLTMNGVNNNSGNELRITHYLELNGVIDLDGESQLVQTGGSIIKGSGNIEKDQQGTASSFNYNYWSSPVAPDSIRTDYKVNEIMFDGTKVGTGVFEIINFAWPHTHADGPKANPIKISDYWINTFRKKTANQYSAWEPIGSYTPIKIGEGYTMKGTEDIHISEGKLQNYTFKGFPNNGDIYLAGLLTNQNYLIGNPYPSAIDGDQFIKDNASNNSHNSKINFNGVLYFWDHFAGKTHILADYVGGYAARVINVGVAAAATDDRINSTGESSTDYFTNQERIPQRYIPVGQGFFINTVIDPSLGNVTSVNPEGILFKNSQRKFALEGTSDSQFLKPEYPSKGKNNNREEQEERSKVIRLNFRSPLGYNRQIAIATDKNTTNEYDVGYDAPLNDNFPEDMYWLINSREFVIQGVPNYNLDQTFPIGIHTKENGTIKIEIGGLENVPEDLNIFIKDSLFQTYHNLRTSEYELELEAGETFDRFALVFQKEKDPEPDPEPEPNPIEKPNPDLPNPLPPGTIDVIFAENEHQLMILNPYEMQIEQVEIYNLLGQRMESFTSTSNQKEMILQVKDHPVAIYVVKVYAVEGMVSKNILLMK
ncbi:LamG-like jellyroll fold domain-containing protein [Gillisia limnaea]